MSKQTTSDFEQVNCPSCGKTVTLEQTENKYWQCPSCDDFFGENYLRWFFGGQKKPYWINLRYKSFFDPQTKKYREAYWLFELDENGHWVGAWIVNSGRVQEKFQELLDDLKKKKTGEYNIRR